MKNFPTHRLKNWFLKEKRSLPWREERTPYRVLVSEIMLQQTQAAAVEPYYIRWMERFPSLEDLSQADEIEVLKYWEGLGYYSRARALHKIAKLVIADFQGEIPSKREALMSLPGIGPYTAAAVEAFAFQKKAVAIDGNVLRVASRLFAIKEDIKEKKTRDHIEKKLLPLLEEVEEPWVVSEALIELGAVICTKTPSCSKCPLKEPCLAYQEKTVTHYPVKKKLASITHLERDVIVAFHDEEILICHRKESGLMKGLYEFPYFLRQEESAYDKMLLFLNEKGKWIKDMPARIQTFTRYRALLYPHVWELFHKEKVEQMFWVTLQEADKLPFSSAHRKILAQFMSER